MTTTPTTKTAIPSALLIVDPQVAFGGTIPVPGAEAAVSNMKELARQWRALGRRVIITKHCYRQAADAGQLDRFLPGIGQLLAEDSPGASLYPGIFEPNDVVINKTRFDATLGTNLLGTLADAGDTSIAVCGLTTPVCVQATVDALSMRDLAVTLVADACASQQLGATSPLAAHDAAVERMRALLANVTDTATFTEKIADAAHDRTVMIS